MIMMWSFIAIMIKLVQVLWTTCMGKSLVWDNTKSWRGRSHQMLYTVHQENAVTRQDHTISTVLARNLARMINEYTNVNSDGDARLVGDKIRAA